MYDSSPLSGDSFIVNSEYESWWGALCHRVIANGEGMRRAKEAIENCQPSLAQRALIGSEPGFPSTYEELYGINRIFALTFRKAVEYGFNNPDDSDWDEE